MITLITEDGYKFYLLEDGRVVDQPNGESLDMSFESIEEFVKAMQS